MVECGFDLVLGWLGCAVGIPVSQARQRRRRPPLGALLGGRMDVFCLGFGFVGSRFEVRIGVG